MGIIIWFKCYVPSYMPSKLMVLKYVVFVFISHFCYCHRVTGLFKREQGPLHLD